MRSSTSPKHFAFVMLASIAFSGTSSADPAGKLPDFMRPISGVTESSTNETATKNMLALNTGMFELYGEAAKIFQQEHPGAASRHPRPVLGRRRTLHPLSARQAAARCATGADRLSVAQIDRPQHHGADPVVVAVYRQPRPTSPGAARCWLIAAACNPLWTVSTPRPIQPDWRDNNHIILQNNIAFMDDCLARGTISFAALREFSKKQGPYLKKNVAWAAETQVAHWMGVLADWKKLLGTDWDKTYAASNTIYVARQNNVLFSVLAQFFGPEAINSRLMLIETISFTTTPEDMLDSLTRIIADRSVGSLFFGNYHLMDYELMGGDARAAIIAESAKRGMTPFLPPLVPFGSKQWPTLITPGTGPASIADLPCNAWRPAASTASSPCRSRSRAS